MSAFDRELLDSLVADGWLRCQRHPEADLWIYNYTEKTQYANHWTPETLACRGLILDADGGIVARPFPKFFNYGTPQVGELPNEPFVVREKIDGSLGILYYLDGEPRIATRGSFTSEQAVEATAMLADYELHCSAGVTPLFEIVYPSNRIVVDYGARRALVLLAAIEKTTGAESLGPYISWSGPAAKLYDHDDLDTLASLAEPNREGFVVTFESGLRVKVKFDEYVRLHKIITGVNARMIWETMYAGDDLDALLTGVPDEIYDWIARTRAGIQADFDAMCNAAMRVFLARPVDADRKALAAYFIGSDANHHVLFRMLDGKPYDDLIWRSIRPGPLTPAGVFAEEASDGE